MQYEKLAKKLSVYTDKKRITTGYLAQLEDMTIVPCAFTEDLTSEPIEDQIKNLRKNLVTEWKKSKTGFHDGLFGELHNIIGDLFLPGKKVA